MRKFTTSSFTILASLMLIFQLVSCGGGGGGGGDESESSGGGVASSWIGTWKVISATADGELAPIFNGSWILTDSSWTLTTTVCAANGPLSSSGDNLTLTVGSTTCPDTVIPPEGRTATGVADVNGDKMTLTITHELEGVNHTLVTENERQ